MSRAEREAITHALRARALQQRRALARELAPLCASAASIDRAARLIQGRMVGLGLVAGVAAGILIALRPRLLVAAARSLVAAWPLMQRLRR
jgi:hypothetical protein